MKSIINKISQALQIVLLAPIKLPGKALNIIKYVAVGLGILETVLDKDEGNAKNEQGGSKGQTTEDEEKVIVGYIDVSEEAEEEKEVSDE